MTEAQQIAVEATARILEEKIRTRTARVGIVGLGLRRSAPGRGVCQGGVPGDRNRRQRRKSQAGKCRRFLCRRYSERCARPAGGIRQTARHHRFFGRARAGHHQHLRPHAAAQDQGPGHELHRRRLPGNREVLPCRDAGDSGIHHLSRHHRRSRAAHAREIGPRSRAGFLPLLLAGARRSGQSQVPDLQHPEGGGRRDAGLHRDGPRCSTRRRSRRWSRSAPRRWPKW